MSELFGAPSGVLAWDQNARANAETEARLTESRLKSLGELDKLARAPANAAADAALTAARTREQNALADQNELKTAVARQQLGFEDAYKAFQKLSASAGAQGQMATWQDLPGVDSARATNPDGTQKSMTQEILDPTYAITKPLEDKLAFMTRMGAPTSMTLPLIKEIVDAKQKTATGSYREAQAREQNQKVQMQQIKQLGGEVAAAATDDHAYAQLMMRIKNNPDPRVRQLAARLNGTDRVTDAPQLLAFAKATLDYETQVKNKVAEAKLKLEQEQLEVSKGKAKVAARVADAQVKHYTERSEALRKDGGEGTVNQVAVAEQKAYSTYMKLKKEREAAYPLAPLDFTFYDRHPGMLFTAKNGSVGRVVIKDGKRMWDEVKPPLKEVPPPRSLEDIAAGRKAKRAAAILTDDATLTDDEED